MILVFFVSLYFSEFIATTYLSRSFAIPALSKIQDLRELKDSKILHKWRYTIYVLLYPKSWMIILNGSKGTVSELWKFIAELSSLYNFRQDIKTVH